MTKEELKKRTKQFALNAGDKHKVEPLFNEANKLVAIFASSINTVRKRK